MVNLLPEKRRGKDEVLRVLGVDMGQPRNLTEKDVAFRLDRFLRDRPHLEFSNEQVRKAFACALTLVPAVYIDVESLQWEAETPPIAEVERAVAVAVRKVAATAPPTLRHFKEYS